MEVSISISVGEFLDRMSILKLKRELIKDKTRIQDVENEIKHCSELFFGILLSNKRLYYYYTQLINVNRDLWEIIDAVKGLDGKTYSKEEMLSKYEDCFVKTTFRFMIKSKINTISCSKVVEQKDCAIKEVKYISVCYGRDLLVHNGLINLLICHHPRTVIVITKRYHSLVKKLYNDPTVDCIEPVDLPEGVFSESINNIEQPISNFLNKYDLTDTQGKTIDYLMGGRLGDMIHSLYVIMCNYRKYGIKGNLIVTNNTKYGGDSFLKDPHTILKPIETILLNCGYINEIIYDDSDDITFEINLNMFRCSPLLYSHNWIEVQMDLFNVPLFRGPFLNYTGGPCDFSTREQKDLQVIYHISEYVIVHRKNTEDRSVPELTPFLNDVIKNNKCVYVYFGNDINKEFGEDLEYLQLKDLKELMYLLTLCKFCICNQTGILAFAFAMGIPVLCEHNVYKAYMGHEEYNPNFFWISKDQRSTNFDQIDKYLHLRCRDCNDCQSSNSNTD